MKLFHRNYDPQDVGLAIFLDDFTTITCDLEHPRLPGNECLNEFGHTGEHEDAAGNTWKGKDYE
jgi:hypothetical protein